jgi:hypothetical protein
MMLELTTKEIIPQKSDIIVNDIPRSLALLVNQFARLRTTRLQTRKLTHFRAARQELQRKVST